MPKAATNLAAYIRDKTLELLQEKEPEEISTRDIAKACGVTATSLYYYYRDREAIFTGVKLYCIEEMDRFISGQVVKRTVKQRRSGKPADLWGEVRAGFEAFRDWAFSNPRTAILVMGRFKADTGDDPGKMEKYYRSTLFAKGLLDRLVEAGLSDSRDTLRDACLCIAALWGAIESVLLNRTIPRFWTRRGGLEFTNSMIDLLTSSLAHTRSKRYGKENSIGNKK